MIIKENNILKVNNLKQYNYLQIKIFKNPSKIQFNNLLNEDKYHLVRILVDTDYNTYCWRSYQLTHEQAAFVLERDQAIKNNYICGLIANKDMITIANSYDYTDVNLKELLNKAKEKSSFLEKMNV